MILRDVVSAHEQFFLALRANSHVNSSTEMLRYLYCCLTCATSTCVNEDSLAIAKSSDMEKRIPRCNEINRDGASFCTGHIAWYLGRADTWAPCICLERIEATGRDAISGTKMATGSDPADNPSAFESQEFRIDLAQGRETVSEVDTTILYLDFNLSCLKRLGKGNIFDKFQGAKQPGEARCRASGGCCSKFCTTVLLGRVLSWIA